MKVKINHVVCFWLYFHFDIYIIIYIYIQGWDDNINSSVHNSTPHIFLLLHTNCISNSAILCNNYISLLSNLCACVHAKKKWCCKGSHSSSVSSSNRLLRLQICKKWWAGALLSRKCCCFVRKPSWKSPPSEEEERNTFWLSGDFLVWYFRDAFQHHWVCCLSRKHSKMNGRLL